MKEKLLHISEPEDSFLNECKQDKRKGVQKLVENWWKRYEHERALKETFNEMMQYEKSLWENGIHYIAGIDEVGRGPLAGPVVAAAVILPVDFYLPGLTDSKKLSHQKREEFYSIIKEEAISCSVGIVSAKEIDAWNIYEATKKAMIKAINGLEKSPEHLLIDAMKIDVPIKQTSIIKGDQKSISIAASSVIAKVTRDNYMKDLGSKYPNYFFEKHMGYGTKEHLVALEKYGYIEEHRQSFAPVKSVTKARTK
ncbi:ribonuclease HII [Bacillus carboniphilus]|uniref:Ribonuclease HII n=1 Tax=Bacillus carboniphilus TaxID=86663 RepID=A0ABY9JXZ9_9BACI|nr:ribonuclease HII [Bacillus carboniphilus]WLR44261.1 ribonuclease HII [Bacillus carboniphilus]